MMNKFKTAAFVTTTLLFGLTMATLVSAQESETSLKQKFQAKLAKAQQGDANAQLGVGYAYETGKGVKKDTRLSVQWYRVSAQQGNRIAQDNLGLCYEHGRGVDKNLTQAAAWYRKAADQGYARAQYNLGACYDNGKGIAKDETKAVMWYRKAAEQGHVRAQKYVAYAYKFGSGVQKDYKQAAFWFSKAAEQGSRTAQADLGDFYENGLGVEKNLAQAFFWYKKSAEQGDYEGRSNLGRCYRFGIGVKKNGTAAKTWLKKAAEHGFSSSWCTYANFLSDSDSGLPIDRPEALKWYLKAANKGHKESIRKLGLFYEEESNFKSAIHWLRKGNHYHLLISLYEEHFDDVQDFVSVKEACRWRIAIAEGDDLKLGELYLSGWRADHTRKGFLPVKPFLIKPDTAKAIHHFEKVASKGNIPAMCGLGEIYASKSGEARDPNKALQWYLKAARLGSIEAHWAIAESCETGGFVQKNVSQAVEWYLRAMVNGNVRTSYSRSSYVELRRLFATGKITGMSAGEFEKRFESALKAGLEKSFVKDKASNRALNDIYSFDSLRRSLIFEESLAGEDLKNHLRYPLSRLEYFANGGEGKAPQREAVLCLMDFGIDGIIDYRVWLAKLEEQIERSRQRFLAGRSKKSEVEDVAKEVLTLAEVYRAFGKTNSEEDLLTKWNKLCQTYKLEEKGMLGLTYAGEIKHLLVKRIADSGESAQLISLFEQEYRKAKKLWDNFAHEPLETRIWHLISPEAERLALVLVRNGRTDKAIAIFNEVFLACNEDVSNASLIDDGFLSYRAQIALQYAAMLQKSGRLKEAKDLYNTLLLTNTGDSTNAVVSVLSGLAITNDELGNSEEALVLFRECEKGWEKFSKPGSKYFFTFPGSLRYAKLLQKNGESKAAESAVLNRIKCQEKILDIIWPEFFASRTGDWLRMTYETYESPELFLTDLYVNDGQRQKAFAHQNELIQAAVSSTQLRLAYLPASRRNKYLREQFQPRWKKALSFAKQYESTPQITNLAAGWLLNGKGIEHDLLAEASFSSSEKLAPLVSKLKLVRARMAAIAKDQDELDQASQQTLDKLKQKQDSLESKLIYERVQRTGIEPWVSIESLRQAIPPHASFVNIARVTPYDFEKSFDSVKRIWTAPRYYAWVIPPTGKGDVQFVDLGSADSIDRLIAEVRTEIQQSIRTFAQSGEQVSEDKLKNRLQALSSIVYGPLKEYLDNTSEMIVSPDGNLWTIPWEMLRKDGQYLIESKQIRYVTSGRELTRKLQHQDKLNPPAVFAAIDYDASERLGTSQRTNTRSAQRGLRFAPLAHSLAEAKSVSPAIEHFSKNSPTQYLGAAARESTFKALKRPEVLMISSHGYFNPGKHIDGALLRCGLAFAGANRSVDSSSGNLEDGILTGLEIVGTDLRGTELVVLSACETGLGEIQNGEGVAGLRQAFQLAGAHSVVSSLWQVEDGETARLMKLFFQNLAEGKTKSEALRQAQLTRIKARRDRHGAAHPFFWAAFTLTGQD